MQSLFVTFLALVFGMGAFHGGSNVPTPPPVTPTEEVVIDPGIEAQLSDAGDKLVQDNLVAPLNKLNKLSKDMFSRCGSGYYYAMLSAPSVANNYYMGQVKMSVGCDEPKDIVKLRVNKDQTVVEVLDAATKKYVSPQTWIEQYKTGNATL